MPVVLVASRLCDFFAGQLLFAKGFENMLLSLGEATFTET